MPAPSSARNSSSSPNATAWCCRPSAARRRCGSARESSRQHRRRRPGKGNALLLRRPRPQNRPPLRRLDRARRRRRANLSVAQGGRHRHLAGGCPETRLSPALDAGASRFCRVRHSRRHRTRRRRGRETGAGCDHPRLRPAGASRRSVRQRLLPDRIPRPRLRRDRGLRIYGVDFTCAPRKAKPITVASGRVKKSALEIQAVENLFSFPEFEAFLARPGPWLGGFDFPFSLPLELARELGWPKEWAALVAHCAAYDRPAFRRALDEYRRTRQPGRRYAHRATDLPAGSSSPMKLVNPPVALMFHEGARRLVAAGVHVPTLHQGDSSRIAIEAYPGLLVRRQLGIRDSYKSDARAEQTSARKVVRKRVVQALKRGEPLGIAVNLDGAIERLLMNAGSGDALDAAICAVQAAWGWQRRAANYGFPPGIDAGEGWIVTA